MSTVVVVNNSRAMRKIIARALRQIGFSECNIIEADSGTQVIGICMLSPVPSLVISDWDLPDMTGIKLLDELRQDHPQICFGMIVYESTEAMLQDANSAGANFLLGRPFTAQDLERLLEDLL